MSLSPDSPDASPELLKFMNFDDLFEAQLVPSSLEQPEQSEKGCKAVVQNFYEGPERCECCVNWVEKRPQQLPEFAQVTYDEAAVCVFQRKNHEESAATRGGLVKLKHHLILIQSQYLIDLIRPSLLSAGCELAKEGTVQFKAPFKDLYFAYDRLCDLERRLSYADDHYVYIELLMNILKTLFSEFSQKIGQLTSSRLIDFKHLWALFPKNSIVVKSENNDFTLWQVIDTWVIYERIVGASQHSEAKARKDESFGNERAIGIECQQIRFDGVNFGTHTFQTSIRNFDGMMPITDLELYPVRFHTDNNIARKSAVRGKKVLGFQQRVHCEYHGKAREAWDTSETSFTRTFVSGKVVVDVFHAVQREGDFEDVITDPLKHLLSVDKHHQSHHHGIVGQESSAEKLPRIHDYDRRPPIKHLISNRQFFMENPQYLMIMCHRLPGFSLQNNQWYWLDVSKLSPISWPEQPLDKLVIDKSTKDLISAFAHHHSKQLRSCESDTDSKGQGLTILLTGPPGTGKTFTAEVVADETKLPIYRVLAGELGSQPESIESRLRKILHLATDWGAILLFDEADTFLQIRGSTDRVGAEIASIFLRQLEYYRGIIILTSNLPENIDTAIKSRCRLAISYSPLTAEARRLVWKTQFEQEGLLAGSSTAVAAPQGGKIHLNDEEWSDLAMWFLSGRDIHNVVQNLKLWSRYSGEDIPFARLVKYVALTVPGAHKDHESVSVSDGPGEIEGLNRAEATDSHQGSRKRPRLGIA